MTSLGRLGALVVKELLAVWRDKKSRFVLIVPPLIQLFVFSYAATFDVINIPIAVLNKDAGRAGRDLVARLEGAPAFSRVIPLGREADIAPTIDARRAMAVLHIDQDFTRRLIADPPASLQVILDGRMSNTAQIVNGYLGTIVAEFSQDWLRETGRAGAPAVLVTRAWYNPNLLSLWVVVPGLVGILTMVVALVVTGLSVARERELGTFEQLLVTPLRPWEIVVGKTVPAMLIGLLEGSLIIGAALAWFRVPLAGDVFLLYVSLIVFLTAVIGVGLFISSLVDTQQQAILGSFLFLVPAVILSGFITPVDNMPDWLWTATLINPFRHFLVIIQGIFLKDLPFALVWESLWPLLLIAAGTLAGAGWFFRHRLY